MVANQQSDAINSTTVFVYDGDCGFCTQTADRYRRLHAKFGDSTSVFVAPWQSLDLDSLALTVDDVMTSVWWVEPDGSSYGANEAASQALIRLGLPFSPLGRLIQLPGFSHLAALLYRAIAKNRYRLPGSTCEIPQSGS